MKAHEEPVQDTTHRPYTESKERAVKFNFIDQTDGYKGLAYAILLMAISDGCDGTWLQAIADAYEIQVPEGMLFKTPVKEVCSDGKSGFFIVDQEPSKKRRKLVFKSRWIEGFRLDPAQFSCRMNSHEQTKTHSFSM